MAAQLNENVEEYMEALYDLTEASATVKTSQLALHLSVSPASVTEMVQRLASQGLVRYTPYKGVSLTDSGAKLAKTMKRRHRLAEKFLADILGIPMTDVHDAACRWEHAITPQVEEAMCQLLGHPTVCPDDGMPIPPCEDFDRCLRRDPAARTALPLLALASLTHGERGTIVYIQSPDGEALQQVGIHIGDEVEVQPGPTLPTHTCVRIGGTTHLIAPELAMRVLVRRPST